MKISSVCIVGGSGFVGRALADQLAARGMRIRVITRSRPRAMPLAVLPTLDIVVGSAHDPATLARAFAGMDAVVNLVGILHEGGRQDFRACHVELPRKVAEACRKAGVQQLLHMSALGADPNGPSEYQRTKGEGEAAVRAAAGVLPVTIFRPSLIFGEGGGFVDMFARLLRLLPVFPLARAEARFQPVWVEDVARAFAEALGNRAMMGNTYELGGPRVYTMAELVRFVAATLGLKRSVIALPRPLGELQALVLEFFPGKPMTRDNLRSMGVDNVCSQPFPGVLGFQPAAMESIVPEYLSGSAARARYPRYRHFAGR
jgi:uncharacterized protein YbjT (DUF2867 family)